MAKIIISSKILRTRKALLLTGLSLEIQGFIPAGRRSCSEIIKEEFGISGTKRQQYKQLEQLKQLEDTSNGKSIRCTK